MELKAEQGLASFKLHFPRHSLVVLERSHQDENPVLRVKKVRKTVCLGYIGLELRGLRGKGKGKREGSQGGHKKIT